MRPYCVPVSARTQKPPSPHLRLVSAGDAEAARRTPGLTDAELVLLCRVRERGAFEELYRRHAASALALAVRIQGNTVDVEDIVHDAFVRAHDHLDKLRSGDSFRAWLGSIVVRLIRTRLRRRRLLTSLGLSRSEPIDLDAVAAPSIAPEERLELAEVYAILEGLPLDRRIAWTLRYIEGRKLEEVAEMTGCSLATAKRWIAQAQEAIVSNRSLVDRAPERARALEGGEP